MKIRFQEERNAFVLHHTNMAAVTSLANSHNYNDMHFEVV